jgi:hypothetical protein
MEKLVKYKREIFGILLGALAGFLYWYYIGCLSGHCELQSTPTVDIIYGTILGYLLFSRKSKKD